MFGESSHSMGIGTRSSAFSNKEFGRRVDFETSGGGTALIGNKTGTTGHNLSRPSSRFGLTTPTILEKRWENRSRALVDADAYGKSLSSFHGSVLHVNIVRVLILFNLPITVFSVWHMLSPSSSSSTSTFPDFATEVIVSNTPKALAALSLALLSLLIPNPRIRFTSTI
ncbi:hypothetical protein VKT23_001617 [Stygiomarasmius scandens]|uniref:Uncharacterized protein n=1 Tax=Marasmiellus scandens TaxID=2682957 RepID=A0ABR1K2A2_9AGAR